jgi:hypothetical protein
LAVEPGLGYRFNRHLLVKAEYTFEQGKEVGVASATTESIRSRSGLRLLK